jgi:hypothetical protein
VTAPQLVDSTGQYMVKGSVRPALRLVLVGAGLVAVTYLASWLPAPTLNQLAQLLRRLLGWPLIVLGGICLVFFGLGLWLRQIAGEATEFYNQVADAQFITVTKNLKRRLAAPYRVLLDQRVIAPEAELADGDEQQLAPADNVVRLMWDDYLDGAPFHPSDTRTTNQLLGNLALVSLRDTRLVLDRGQRKRLKRLDLVNTRMSLRGPYLWFHCISRSIIQQTAKLAIDYNAFALPLSRVHTAQDWEILRYVKWLCRRLKCSADELALPEPFRLRFQSLPPDVADSPPAPKKGRFFQGNDFSAIHFLAIDPAFDADIRDRYGPQVADLVQRDRRDNIRRVFRSYPFHHWPKDRRVLNPLHLYQRHLEGGRVLVLPFKLLWWMVVLAWRAGCVFWVFVREVLEPRVGAVDVLEESDPFAVAVRKIHRMRKPLFMECLRVRAAFDPEYLGVMPPGRGAERTEPSGAEIERDLESLGAAPTLKAEFRALADQRRTQLRDLRRRLGPFGLEDASPESLRAAAIAYSVDYRGVRSRLEATELVRKTFDRACASPTGPLGNWTPGALWCRWRFRGRMDRLFQQPALAHYDQHAQSICRGVVCRERGALIGAVRQLTNGDSTGADPIADAREVLAGAARDPETWTRQLMTLRAVQTLSVVDLKVYRDLVAELGEYDVRATDDET